MMDIRHQVQILKSIINDCIDSSSSRSKEEKMQLHQEARMRGLPLLLMETTQMKAGHHLVGCAGDRKSDYDAV